MALSLRVLAPLWKLGRLGNVEDDPAAKTIRRLEGRLLDLEVNHRLLQQALELLSTVLQPDSNGLLLTPYIHNTTGNTGNAQSITSGAYTPTLTGITNVTSSVAFAGTIWLRIGSIVVVPFTVAVTPTAATSATTINISLPIVSNLTNTWDCCGTATGQNTTTVSAGNVSGDTANDAAALSFVSQGAGAQIIFRGIFGFIVK